VARRLSWILINANVRIAWPGVIIPTAESITI
jgi:hypothetical protein